MNYRHAFHAGNFADVVKHAVLALLIERLKAKETAFRVIDTHAGIGLYDLAGDEARRTGEWRNGIGRVYDVRLPPAIETLMRPYLEAVRAANGPGPLARYPGSPWIVHHLLRRQDRLTAVELHPADAEALRELFAGDRQVKTIALDGWLALGSFVPPKERRGLVLVDPPYEAAAEFARLAQALEAAHRKWAAGSYLAWYPIKDRDEPDALARRLRRAGIGKILRVELGVAAPSEAGRLTACGLIAINPPWTLADELALLLPELTRVMSENGAGRSRVDWLTGEL